MIHNVIAFVIIANVEPWGENAFWRIEIGKHKKECLWSNNLAYH